MPKYQCPDCHAVLRRAEAIATGKKIRCPKCEAVFAAHPMEEEEEPAKEEAAAGYALAGASPAPPPKPGYEEDEDSNPYSVIKESGDEIKPEIHLGSLRDRFAKSKIGPAMFKTVMPSNYLLRLGLFSCIAAVAIFIYGAWPIIFCEATTIRPFVRPRVDIMIRATFMFAFGAIMCMRRLQDARSNVLYMVDHRFDHGVGDLRSNRDHDGDAHSDDPRNNGFPPDCGHSGSFTCGRLVFNRIDEFGRSRGLQGTCRGAGRSMTVGAWPCSRWRGIPNSTWANSWALV